MGASVGIAVSRVSARAAAAAGVHKEIGNHAWARTHNYILRFSMYGRDIGVDEDYR